MNIRERAVEYGTKALNNNEMIKLLTGADINLSDLQTVNQLRDKIELLEITDLQKLKLEALFNFADRTNRAKVERIKISSPDDAAMVVMEELRYCQKGTFQNYAP